MTETTVQAAPAFASDDADAGTAPAPPEVAAPDARELVEADLLVEDVSIDGMCGVY